MLEKKPTRQSARPLRAAMIAACACLLLVGTVLATSPELRNMLWLWDSFEPYVEEVDAQADPKAVGVYDGMEAQIVATVSDGYATVCHVEFRDLEGDRIAQLMAQGREAAQEELWQYRYTVWSHTRGSYTSSDGSFIAASMSGHKILDYDRETGVLTLEYSIIETVPAEAERRLYLNIPIGFLRTYTDRGPEAGGTQDELFKWQLNASIQPLDIRDVSIEDVPVTLQNWTPYLKPFGEVDPTITLQKAMVSPVAVSITHSAFNNVQAKSIELVVELADGTTVGSSRYGHSTYTTGEDSVIVGFEDGEAVHGPQTYTSTWILEEAIDPHQVVALWVDGVCIPLD